MTHQQKQSIEALAEGIFSDGLEFESPESVKRMAEFSEQNAIPAFTVLRLCAERVKDLELSEAQVEQDLRDFDAATERFVRRHSTQNVKHPTQSDRS